MSKNGDLLGKVLDNRRVFYATKIVEGYIAHLSINWLFITGDNNPRHHAPSMSLLYLIEMPFLLLGIYSFLFLPIRKQTKWLVCLWFLLVPIPASITSGVPHAVRTINFLPLFQVFTATGLVSAYAFLQKYKGIGISHKGIRLLLFSLFFVLATYNFAYYLNQYFVQMNKETSRDWQYGYEEAVPFIASVSNRYDKIIISNKEPLDQSYISFYIIYNMILLPINKQQKIMHPVDLQKLIHSVNMNSVLSTGKVKKTQALFFM